MKKIFILLWISILLVIFPSCIIDALMIDNICANPLADKTRVTIKFVTNSNNQIKDLNYCSNCGSGSFDLPVPIRDGYTFGGWYADMNLTKKVNNKFIKNIDGEVITIIPSVAGCNVKNGYTYLYAKWDKQEDIDITINFNTGSDEKIEPINICSTCLESEINLPILHKEGYVFLGWYQEAELINKVNIKNNKSKDIYEKIVLETKTDNGTSTHQYGTLYARWIEQGELKYLIIDEVDKRISIMNDLMNR